MHKFVDEQALRAEVSIAKIIAEHITLGVKPYVAVWGHGHAAQLKPKISAIVDADAIVIERGPENGFRQRSFADGQGPARFVRAEHV